MFRRLRAALSIGIVWALVWLPIGGALALYADSTPPQPSDLLHRPVAVPVFLAAWTLGGGLSGAVFALILGATERRRTLLELSLIRTSLWGAFGAMSLPALLIAFDVLHGLAASPLYDWRPPLVSLGVSAILGAACAAATLAMARRSPG